MHGLFVQLSSYLKASKYIARTKERSTRIRDVADLPPGRRVQRARARRDGVAPNLARWKRTPS